ncbi:hypothetical protein Pcinc_021140 [Petrolisthes cinctipes]|uniref:Uncharacterized protein n=1 Tax=Petrolisthes cinctipes TaxID=88211 RepID=A0AAE1KI14_PETCI|nr:hypothetical protein Pcinc_021140 [Petrolisthes cinctipes]
MSGIGSGVGIGGSTEEEEWNRGKSGEGGGTEKEEEWNREWSGDWGRAQRRRSGGGIGGHVSISSQPVSQSFVLESPSQHTAWLLLYIHYRGLQGWN